MADSNAQADIRGIDIDKLVKGFADEELVLKKFLSNSTTKAREIRWFQKTAGFLDSPDTTGITSSQIANASSKARPVVVEPSWTRNTSYVRKYFVESPLIMEEDIKDTDVDILGTVVRDLVRAVQNQVDVRCYNVLTENLTPVNILTTAAVDDGWDDTATGDPIKDLMTGKRKIRQERYNPDGAILYINSIEEQNLINYIISVKGSSLQQLANDLVKGGKLMGLLNLTVVVSENATTDYALMFVPNRSATWKSFMPLTHATITDPGIGRKIRVWEEGEAILTDPKSVHLTTDTVV